MRLFKEVLSSTDDAFQSNDEIKSLLVNPDKGSQAYPSR